MGIYGALSTAVTGLRAQSFALENISGNIANSQTTGFKRIDTDFVDLIPDAPSKLQTSGSVLAQSRSTASIQGDVKSVTSGTNMAINGSGFFVVESPIGQSDGNAVFSGTSYYTRRGDFDLNKDGYLVNGSGYYLKGLPIDASTQNVSGSVPQVLKISNSFLPAAQSTRINYQLNLPQLPKTTDYTQFQTSGSELLQAQHFSSITPDVPAKAAGSSATSTAASSTIAANGNTLTVKVGSNAAVTFNFTNTGGTTGNSIDLTDSATVGDVLSQIQTQLVAGGATGATASIVNGKLQISAGNTTDTVTVGDSTSGMGFPSGTNAATVSPATQSATRISSINAVDSDTFIDESVAGGAVTAYAANGAPAQVQLRWAKVASTSVGGTDTWNLFYQSDSTATGTTPMWTNVGQDFTFDSNGNSSPAVTSLTLNNLSVDGNNLGNVDLDFGKGGITEFADPNGTAAVTALSQNGYAAGQYLSVAINDSGRVVVSYDNGKQMEVAQVITADFNAANQLKRMDGGIFSATSDSGDPILKSDGGVMGSALESSNTDISEEFTRLIVTQQAYAAGTKIVSTADQMLQDALNMIR
jgi:flagellar hook protein FlgE